MNNRTIIGNVGRAVNLRYTPDGTAVADCSVAVNKRTGSGDSKKETTTWFKVTCWRSLAEVVNQYVKVGMKIAVNGEIGGEAYLDKSGQPAMSLKVTANNVEFLSRVEDEGNTQSEPQDGETVDTNAIPF